MSFNPQPLDFPSALLYWLAVAGGMALIVFILSALNLLVGYRGAGGKVFIGELGGYFSDLFSVSFRRVLAIGKLTFMEAYRRKALAVFVVFGLLFMFAGWFMGGNNQSITPDQVKVYISFVLRTISWLTIPLVLILSCFGIPEDIRLRSLHTVVTKPARRLEIVLGRTAGYSAIGLLVLVVMSVVGYVWVVRMIPAAAQREGALICRVPVYGKLHFLDRSGTVSEKGINVGDLWEFRSYIEGATSARAIWTFANAGEHMLDSQGNLHLENQFLAFRSYKGDMKRQLLYDYKFVNPDRKLENGQLLTFTTRARPIRENRGVTDEIHRKLVPEGETEKSYDLIKDFVTKEGYLTVEVSCLDRSQYLGMARCDLFVRLPDRHFATGYFKAVVGIGLFVILVALLCVMASTFLKGPIAAVLVAVLLSLGGENAHNFMDLLVSNKWVGGGTLESVYRMKEHMNPQTELPANPVFIGMKYFDNGMTNFLWLCKQVIPRLYLFNMSEYVANGFDVPWDACLVPCLMMTLGYMIPCVLLGYFALRVRELESK